MNKDNKQYEVDLQEKLLNQEIFSLDETPYINLEFRIEHKDLSWLWIELHAKLIEVISKIDDLTQIPNRRFFMETLKNSVAMSQRHRMPLCLLMIDLDFFKNINDKYGHDVGDSVLVHFAKIIKTTCREEDFPARNGGEEFYIITPMTDLQGAKTLAKRIQDKVRNSQINVSKFYGKYWNCAICRRRRSKCFSKTS